MTSRALRGIHQLLKFFIEDFAEVLDTFAGVDN